MKILILDVETSPHLSFHFRRWQENIPRANTVDESHITCWAAKWAGEREVDFMSEWDDGFVAMMSGLWYAMDDADVVLGFNSDKFDVKRINTEFIKLGWEAPSPYEKVDLYKQIRKNFAFSSNRLKDLLKELGLSPKLEDNANMQLWMDVHFKKPAAQKRMMMYNKQDVRSTEELYDYIVGWIQPHPNWGLHADDVSDPNNPVCPNCGGTHMHKHKVRRTRTRTYQQWKCADCGHYSRGRRNIGVAGIENGIVV